MDGEEGAVVESAIVVYDDESGEVEVGFDLDENPTVKDIVDFVREYVEYTYPETDNLFSVMEEAIEQYQSEDE